MTIIRYGRRPSPCRASYSTITSASLTDSSMLTRPVHKNFFFNFLELNEGAIFEQNTFSNICLSIKMEHKSASHFWKFQKNVFMMLHCSFREKRELQSLALQLLRLQLPVTTGMVSSKDVRGVVVSKEICVLTSAVVSE